MNRMTDTLAAEWIKLWTVRSTWWSLGAAAFLMVGAAGIMGADFAGDVSEGDFTNGTSLAVTGPARDAALIAQFGIITFAMLAVTAEFATGAIRGTFAADPWRGRVLLAKTAAVTGAALPLALLITVAGVLVGDVALGEYGTGGGVPSAVAATTAYLVFGAVFTVGVAALVRSAAGTLSGVVVLLLMLPMMFDEGFWNYLPGGAGLALLGREDPPYSRVVALVLLGVWAVAAQAAGYAAVRRRDV